MLPLNHSTFDTNESKKNLSRVSRAKVKILEKESILSVAERVNLLLVLMKKKWITEVGLNQSQAKDYKAILDQLSLPYYFERYKADTWLQVGVSESVLDYVKQFRGSLSETEAGLLYGYPLTHSLAFTGVLKSRTRKPESAAAFYLGGIYSQEFYEEEVDYFDNLWSLLGGVSPVLIYEAESYYLDVLSKKSRLF